MKAREIGDLIESVAPLCYQEEWDNSGFQVGDLDAEVTGVLLCTDVTEAVVGEAIEMGFNMIISHHPLIFHPLKKILGRTHTERIVATALCHGVTIYSSHTSADNAPGGVSFVMASKLGMSDLDVLEPRTAPDGRRVGSGLVGRLPQAVTGTELLSRLRDAFGVRAIRYSGPTDRLIDCVALCGGAGSFLREAALRAGAQAFVTADVRYHEFMAADDCLLLADIGHYESEQYTKELFLAAIRKKNPNFAVEYARREQNQIKYYQ